MGLSLGFGGEGFAGCRVSGRWCRWVLVGWNRGPEAAVRAPEAGARGSEAAVREPEAAARRAGAGRKPRFGNEKPQIAKLEVRMRAGSRGSRTRSRRSRSRKSERGRKPRFGNQKPQIAKPEVRMRAGSRGSRTRSRRSRSRNSGCGLEAAVREPEAVGRRLGVGGAGGVVAQEADALVREWARLGKATSPRQRQVLAFVDVGAVFFW